MEKGHLIKFIPQQIMNMSSRETKSPRLACRSGSLGSTPTFLAV
jgi:hypothetical protein